MSTRLLILKLAASLAALICGGCNLPSLPVPPTPNPKPAEAPTINLKITVDGEGKVNIGGEGKITAQSVSAPALSRVCDCGCGKDGCSCSRGASSAAQTANMAAKSGPQSLLRELAGKPIVELCTDFDDGRCGACDLAWKDWIDNGKSWPFVVVKVRGNTERGTSPTFRFPGGRVWRPATYSIGDLLREFSK